MDSDAMPPDPYHAPLWRRLLAIRVIALCVIGAIGSGYLMDWSDRSLQDTPKWLRTIGALILTMPFLACFVAIKEGLPDLAIHLLPEGKARRALLWGDEKRTPGEIARSFAAVGYWFALLPLIIPVCLIVLALVAALFIGGVAVVSTIIGGIFSGWPSWAIVITLLLIAILLKK